VIGEWLRGKSRAFVNRVARFIGRSGISPNAFTISGFLLTIPVACFLARGLWQAAGLMLIPAGLFDTIDGAVARATGKESPFGAFLDSTLDRFGEGVIYLGFMLYYLQGNPRLGGLLTYITIVGSLMVSYTRARAEGLGVECKGGFFTRFERIALLIIGLLLAKPIVTLGALALFSNLTAIQRMYAVWKKLQ